MQAAVLRRVGAFGTAAPTRPVVASRRTLVVSNVYGDLPKIGAWRLQQRRREGSQGANPPHTGWGQRMSLRVLE